MYIQPVLCFCSETVVYAILLTSARK